MIIQFDEDYGTKKAGQRADMDISFATRLIREGIASIPGTEPEKKLAKSTLPKPKPPVKKPVKK